MPSSETNKLIEDRQRLRDEHASGATGLYLARSLSDSMDEAVTAIWERTNPPPGSALVATGGYGRRELSPASDVDLIVIHSKRSDPTENAKTLAYELWDAGLELGYAIHTTKEAKKLARSRLDSEGSFLDARLVAGDESVFEDFFSEVGNNGQASSGDFVKRVAEATLARHATFGDAGAELEPDLKEGRGGLRDLTILRWLTPLADTPAELTEALDYILRIRHELHYRTGRRTDILAMQHQPKVAEALVGERGDFAAEDVLMRTLYSHCRTVAVALDRALFGEEASRSSKLVAEFSEALAEPGEGSAGPSWPPEALAAFLDLLKSQNGRTLEVLGASGALVRALPEWENVSCLPQRNIYHRYAVDVHTFAAVRAASSMMHSAIDGVEDLVSAAARDAADDLDQLLLAVFFHDIGKGSAEDHSERGAELSAAALERMGVSEGDSEEITWLVRNHLLLSETATRRDIGDEKLILELADTVGSQRRLRLLFLLSAADAIATSSAAWGQWKATLVSRLFARVSHVLENPEVAGTEAGHRVAETIERVAAQLEGFSDSEIRSHFEGMPRSWLLSYTDDVLVAHSAFMLRHTDDTGDDVAITASKEVPSGIWQAVVVSSDRPGLFSKVAGSLALHGLNVLGADVYTREDGMALEVFRLEAIGDEERRFRGVLADLQKSLRGKLALEVRLAEKRRDYASRVPRGKQEPTAVTIDNTVSDFFTVLEVHATDRVGLLYTITKSLADLGMDIHLAKVSTYAEDVVDVFYVKDLEGQKITEEDHISEIRRALIHAIDATRES